MGALFFAKEIKKMQSRLILVVMAATYTFAAFIREEPPVPESLLDIPEDPVDPEFAENTASRKSARLKTVKNACSYTLHGCRGMTKNKVCKHKRSKSQRKHDWEACPYQMPGNFRWVPSINKRGKAYKCSPPRNGAAGYRSNIAFKCCK